ncbi:MAG TPA: hypothetical protein VF209_00495 [Patescibacteria group bacterium]
MKILFLASVHGRKQYKEHCQKIVDLTKAAGHNVDADLEMTHEDMAAWDLKQNVSFHRQLLDKIKKNDVVFAELSHPSTSMGYLVATAIQLGKPVVIFFAGQEEPHLFRTLEETNDKLTIVRYMSVGQLDEEVPIALEFVNSAQDVRFNFFVSPEISSYLDWIAKNKKIPRSVYLRNLIDTDMNLQEDFS